MPSLNLVNTQFDQVCTLHHKGTEPCVASGTLALLRLDRPPRGDFGTFVALMCTLIDHTATTRYHQMTAVSSLYMFPLLFQILR